MQSASGGGDDVVPPLVSVEWLDQNRKARKVTILHATYDPTFQDVGFREYRSQWFLKWGKLYRRFASENDYEIAHIPDAVHFSINCCVYPSRTEKHFAYNNVQIAPYIQKLAIFPADHIVVYSNGPGNAMMYAAKARWLLGTYGFFNVSVLDGGFDQWKKLKKECTKEVVEQPNSRCVPAMINNLHLTFADLLKPPDMPLLSDLQSMNFIDCRAESQFYGKSEPRQFGEAVTGSFIHNSKNVSYLSVLGWNGLMATKEQIKRALKEAEYEPDQRTILFCYDGLQCHLVALAIELVGYEAVPIFSGGLYEVELRRPNLIDGDAGTPLW